MASARANASKTKGPRIAPPIRSFRPTMKGDVSHWRRTNVKPQKQPGYAMVVVTVPLGDVTGEQMRVLADLALSYGDGSAGVTAEQDLHLRLAASGLGLPDAMTIADVTSCPGAESCRLAVTQSRGLGRFLGEHLRSRPDLVAAAPDLQIKVSGCPNGCGRHHIAGLGFQGSTRRLGDRVIPQYLVMVGGAVDDRGAQFGKTVARIPARRMTEAIDRLVDLYSAERSDGETATAFFRRADIARVRERLLELEGITAGDAQPTDYVDLGEDSQYRMETK